MKLTIEYEQNAEPQVTIKGDPKDPRIQEMIVFLEGIDKKSAAPASKAELYREDEMYFIDTKDVLYFEACGDRVTARTAQGEYRSRQRLYQLEEWLGKNGFVQISKGLLLNVDAAISVQAEFSGNYLVSVRGIPNKLVISRRYFKGFKEAVLNQKKG